MHPGVVPNLAAADLERERTNLERGSVVGLAVAGLGRGAYCDVELVLPSQARTIAPARAVPTSEASEELQPVPQNTAYPASVRMAARAMPGR